MSSEDESDKYWAEQRKKNAQLIDEMFGDPGTPFESTPHQKRFPNWTYEELAFYQPDGSIMIVANTNASATSSATHGTRTYKPTNPNYQSFFEKHRFSERTDDYHWIVANEGVIIGEGWGKESESSESE